MSVIWQCDPVSVFSLKESVCSANHIERINSGLLCVETGRGDSFCTYMCDVMSSSGVVVGVCGTWYAAWDGFFCALPFVFYCVQTV